MNLIDITDVLSSGIMLLVTLLCAYLSKVAKDSKNTAELKAWVEIAVNAAEQAYKVGMTTDRKLYATTILKERGLKLNWDEIDTMIEAEVNKIPSAIHTEKNDTVVTAFTEKE